MRDSNVMTAIATKTKPQYENTGIAVLLAEPSSVTKQPTKATESVILIFLTLWDPSN